MVAETTKIKIVSNPYENDPNETNISYFKLSPETNNWININDLNDYDGKLVEKEYAKTFFPFIVKDIVDSVYKDFYTADHTVDLYFEGTRDEYDDLSAICNSGEYNGIQLMPLERNLNNAREIIPEIKDLIPDIEELLPKIEETYRQLNELIENDDLKDVGNNIENELGKVNDVIKKEIPICVVGTVSSGKSTLINALVGREILPSSDEPNTAKVFQISSSKNSETAIIKYRINNSTEKLIFDGKPLTEDESLGDVYNAIASKINKDKTTDIYHCICKSIEILNNYEKEHSDVIIEDLVEVIVPFGSGLLGNSQYDYVIFDTPGSNNASNERHIQVLEKAMADRTNGIPVFVSNKKSLNIKDAKNLIERINGIGELDDRFTMLVVNQADDARLPESGYTEADENEILDQAVPRALRRREMFFVSSIMALGSKIKGDFFDSQYGSVYDERIKNFSEPNSKNYKQLYKYNILPAQIKQKSFIDINQCDNLIFANSGLFTLEKEIETFSEKYSAYNKCWQSKKHLDEAISFSKKAIKKAESSCEAKKQKLEEKFESDKEAIEENLDGRKESECSEALEKYTATIEKTYSASVVKLSINELESRFNDLCEKEFALRELISRRSKFEELKGKKKKAQQENWVNVKQERKPASIIKLMKDNSNDNKEIKKEKDDLRKLESECKRGAREKLIAEKEKECNKAIINAKERIEQSSVDYWEKTSEKIKTSLSDVVTGSEELNEEKRNELSRIILDYNQIRFDEIEIKKFNRDGIFNRFNLFNIHFGKMDTPNYEELSKEFDKLFEERVKEYKNSIYSSFTEEFDEWLESLMNHVKEKMVEYNSSLYEQFNVIERINENIGSLLNINSLLGENSAKIKEFMSFK